MTMTKREMMQRLRDARRRAQCCIQCGAPKLKAPLMGCGSWEINQAILELRELELLEQARVKTGRR
jgi:hypothetical protein